MRVLVIGTGGREHALVTALSLDPAVSHVLAAPGNPGMAAVAELRAVDPMDPAAVAALAVETAADLVIVGPEAPLVAGVADAVRAAGIATFGPSFEAARLEGSKDFSKAVMAAAGIPTARSYTCDTPEQAAAALDEFGAPYVVKDDALAAGKGVAVTDDRDTALAHAAACGRVVIEEYLDGPEVSLFVVCEGLTGVPLLPAQDFKRIGDGDTGLNTGGMGAYAPLSWAPADLVPVVMSEVVAPLLAEMDSRGTPFGGLLFVGLALTAKGPKVIEFNVRFGDPETQVVLPLLRSGLGELLHAAATGKLAGHPPLEWHDGAAVAVVMASAGYPVTSRSGDVITGADDPGVLHAGTARDGAGELVTAGGRVLCCTAVADSVPEARAAAYRLVEKVRFDGAQHRTDIAAER
ncbi:phosphoribosylamine--glycine ligase [Longispora sp. NPDC051575]|uniref:phosphoribosylamine--glycine ligase n=1 Tax=Longispora sp. NPDC051575 TaxID=3154943 RepID=UPI003432CA3D